MVNLQVGNKVDLADQRVITESQGKELQLSLGIAEFIETR